MASDILLVAVDWYQRFPCMSSDFIYFLEKIGEYSMKEMTFPRMQKGNGLCDPYLPIGSVVVLKGGGKKVMIVGRVQQEQTSKEIYDYSSVLWPEGLLDSSSQYMFNHENIDRIYFIGMQNEEEFRLNRFLISKTSASEGSVCP